MSDHATQYDTAAFPFVLECTHVGYILELWLSRVV